MGKNFKPYLKILFLIIIFALLFLIQFLNYLKIINVFVTGVLGTLWSWYKVVYKRISENQSIDIITFFTTQS